MPRASLYTLGCRLNQSETQLLEEKLRAQGYTIVPFGESADLGIINTCTVTNEADAKSRKVLRGFLRENPGAFTAVIGCYAQMGADTLRDIQGVDLIIGNEEKLNVLDYVTPHKQDAPIVVRDRLDRADFEINAVHISDSSRRANLKIQDGCDFMCSFCVIPFARGRARSRSLPDLQREAEQLVVRGAKELVLTGVNIGTYASEEADIVSVVDALNDLPGLPRIRISSIEPTTIPDALFERMADPCHALVPHLHIPLQSGSNRVLERMRRRYTREEFIDFVEHAAKTVPGIGIGTDILVGMPGETDEDFAETCQVLSEGPLFYAHVFKFSPRDGTAAVRMPDPVHGTVKNRRSAVIRELSARKHRAFAENHRNTCVDVLFESQEDGCWTGYTGNYMRVSLRSNDILANQVVRVRIVGYADDVALAEPAKELAPA